MKTAHPQEGFAWRFTTATFTPQYASVWRVLLRRVEQPTTSNQPSPSTLIALDFCQTKWAVEKAGWVPKLATKKLIAACWSTAAHAGFAAYYKALLANHTPDLATITNVAQTEWTAEIDHYLKHGVSFGSLDIEERSTDLVKLLWKWLPECRISPPAWQIVGVEHDLRPTANARPDLIAREPGGKLVVVDFKVKYEVKPKWFDIQAWADEFAADFKQLYYTREVERAFGEPCRRHYIYGVVAKPFDQVLAAYDVPDLRLWERTRLELEARYERTKGQPIDALPGHPTHRSVYGPCEFIPACTLYGLNPDQMALEYTQVPRRERISG